MKYIKTFESLHTVDLNKAVKDLDLKWSEQGMTSGAEDIYYELMEKYPNENPTEIKTAVELFYDIDLDVDTY